MELTPLLRRHGFNRVLLDRLKGKAENEGGYWTKAWGFVQDVAEDKELTVRQVNWLAGIVEELKLPWEVR